MKTLKYALTLAATFIASSVALELSSTSSAISSASSRTSSSKCNHSTSDGMRYCEFSNNDVVLTCDEIQSPDPPNQIKNQFLLDCGNRKLQVRARFKKATNELLDSVRSINLDGCPNQQIDRMLM